MNITNVLDRASHRGAEAPTTGSPHPPTTTPPDAGYAGKPSWPTGAKVLVAILALAALLGVAGTAIGFASGDEPAPSNDALVDQLRGQVATLTAERDAATASVAALDDQIAAVRDELRAAQAERDQLGDQVAGRDDRIAALNERIGALRGRLAKLVDQRDGARATVTELEGQLSTARQQAAATIAGLEGQLSTARQRAAAAIAERDALAKLFPIGFSGAIAIDDVVGNYRLDLKQVYCSGLASCGTAPAITTAKLTATAQDYLRLTMGSLTDANVYRIEGGLHSVAQSTTALPACNGTTRAAHVTTTLYPHGFEVADDGSVDVTSLAGSVTIEAPATGSCPAALAFYSAELTPAS